MRMSGRTLLFIIAAVIAAFTAISVRSRLSQAPVEAAPVANHIIVAKHDLPAGSFVSAQDLEWGAPPAEEAPANSANPLEFYLHEGAVKLTDFNGAVVRRSLHAGEAVPSSALMKSGEGGFMSAVLNPGMRAVSISVTAASGNAGFISPGDHVDLILTRRIKPIQGKDQPDTQEHTVGRIFVHNVRVIAVDQMLDNPENKAILAKTVTVEVNDGQAEEIAVAAEAGKISIALRSLANQPETGAPQSAITDLYGAESAAARTAASGYTRDSDLGSLPQNGGSVTVRVIRGDQIQNLEFFQEAP